MPETRLPAHGRMPLGDAYRGSCHSEPSGVFIPPEATQRDVCNFGYARGRCQRFHGDVDAVRFSIAEERLTWVKEREHVPVEHGVLELEQTAGDVLLAAQARAFVEGYRLRVNRARTHATGVG